MIAKSKGHRAKRKEKNTGAARPAQSKERKYIVKHIIVFLALNFLCVCHVMAEQAAPAGRPGNPLISMAPWILIFVIFYFLLIRPQQKQAKEHNRMLDGLKRGDQVLTQGGIYATIQAVKGRALEVKLNEDVKVLISKTAVSQLVTGDPTRPADAAAAQPAQIVNK